MATEIRELLDEGAARLGRHQEPGFQRGIDDIGGKGAGGQTIQRHRKFVFAGHSKGCGVHHGGSTI